ncbi:MAG: hypothetical protein AB1714_05345 [Acidobacteriota bacterium]
MTIVKEIVAIAMDSGMDIRVEAVHPKKSNTVFVGGMGQGVFRSQNAGKSWQLVNEGLSA